MSAIFTIDQATLPPGVPDQSRQDIIPGGLPVQFAAVFPPPNHATYKWELLSQPSGVALAFSDPAIHNPTVDFGMNYGGYLIRLTVDEGLATEDVSVRAVYLKWPVSSKALPALSETNQDNSQPPNTGYRGWEEKILDYLWWVELTISGGVVTPTGLGRVYVDQLNGSDVTGIGSHEKPYQTLAYAMSTLVPTADPVEFQTPYEFIVAPGMDMSVGPIIPPPRQKVTITGRDVVIQQPIRWELDPSWWPLCGLLPSEALPYLFIDGRVTGDTGQPFNITPPKDLNVPSMVLMGGISAQNVNPGGAGGAWGGDHSLILDGVSLPSISNLPSGGGGPAASDATGTLRLRLSRTVITGLSMPGVSGYIASEKEPSIPNELNLIFLTAVDSRIGSVFANAIIGSVSDSSIDVVHRLADSTGLPIIDGYISCSSATSRSRPVFRNCVFRGGPIPYVFGWDGGTGPAPPDGPSFDKVSYRSLLEVEKAGTPFTVDNITPPNYEVMVDEAPSRIQVIADLKTPPPGIDLVAGAHTSPATAIPIEWRSSLPGFIKDGDFLHPSGPGLDAQIAATRSGRYRAEFTISWENTQVLWTNTLAVGVWLNGVQSVMFDVYEDIPAAGLGASVRGTSVMLLPDFQILAGDIVELRAWLASTFFGITPVYLAEIGTNGRIERVE